MKVMAKSAYPKDSYQKNAPTQNKHPPTYVSKK